MPDFILDYDVLESIAYYSETLGKRSEEYSQRLENKLIIGISEVTGQSSGNLENASDLVRDKVNALKLKSEAFYHFADQIKNLNEVAQQIDKEVADAITVNRGNHEHHISMRLENMNVKLTKLLVELGRNDSLLPLLAGLLGDLDVSVASLKEAIRHWYELGGQTDKTKSNEKHELLLNFGKIGKIPISSQQQDSSVSRILALYRVAAGTLDITGTYLGVAGIAAAGIGIAQLFQGQAFDMLKNSNTMRFSDLKSGGKNGKVDAKTNIKQVYGKLKNTIKEFIETVDDARGEDKTAITLGDVIRNNLNSYPYDMDSKGFHLSQQYYLAWYYGTNVYERVDESILGHSSYLVYSFDKMRKRGVDLSTLTVDEVDKMCFDNESFWYKLDTAAITAFTVYSSYLGAKESGAIAKGGKSSKFMKQLDDMSQNKINHIIEGSKNSNHGWEHLVPDKDWNKIKGLVAKVMDTGIEGPYKSVFSKKAIINGYEVEVTYTKLSDGTIKISDAWINH